jgi:hypothetical protein
MRHDSARLTIDRIGRRVVRSTWLLVRQRAAVGRLGLRREQDVRGAPRGADRMVLIADFEIDRVAHGPTVQERLEV